MVATYSKCQNETADIKVEFDTLKQKYTLATSARTAQAQKQLGDASAGNGVDREFMELKFEEWKRKMICMTCRANENDIVLSCGHTSCSSCIEESFASRQRVCPVDRKKITRSDVIKIFWNDTE